MKDKSLVLRNRRNVKNHHGSVECALNGTRNKNLTWTEKNERSSDWEEENFHPPAKLSIFQCNPLRNSNKGDNDPKWHMKWPKGKSYGLKRVETMKNGEHKVVRYSTKHHWKYFIEFACIHLTSCGCKCRMRIFERRSDGFCMVIGGRHDKSHSCFNCVKRDEDGKLIKKSVRRVKKKKLNNRVRKTKKKKPIQRRQQQPQRPQPVIPNERKRMNTNNVVRKVTPKGCSFDFTKINPNVARRPSFPLPNHQHQHQPRRSEEKRRMDFFPNLKHLPPPPPPPPMFSIHQQTQQQRQFQAPPPPPPPTSQDQNVVNDMMINNFSWNNNNQLELEENVDMMELLDHFSSGITEEEENNNNNNNNNNGMKNIDDIDNFSRENRSGLFGGGSNDEDGPYENYELSSPLGMFGKFDVYDEENFDDIPVSVFSGSKEQQRQQEEDLKESIGSSSPEKKGMVTLNDNSDFLGFDGELESRMEVCNCDVDAFYQMYNA